MDINNSVLEWLLEEDNPSVRYRTMTELLDVPAGSPEAVKTRADIESSEPVQKIFARMHPDGCWLQKKSRTKEFLGEGVEYGAEATTHFMLSYLSELGLTREHPLVYKAADRYLNLQQSDGDFWLHLSCLFAFNIRTFIRLGFRDDPRVQKTIDLMLNTVKLDGGYLCELHEGKYKTREVKSCIRGCVKALTAFAELPEYWGHRRCLDLVDYFLHRECLYRMTDPSRPVSQDVIRTSFPFNWRASVVEIVYGLSRMGYGGKNEAAKAWAVLEEKKDNTGRYILDWSPSHIKPFFKVGKKGEPNKWVTLYALLAQKDGMKLC